MSIRGNSNVLEKRSLVLEITLLGYRVKHLYHSGSAYWDFIE